MDSGPSLYKARTAFYPLPCSYHTHGLNHANERTLCPGRRSTEVEYPEFPRSEDILVFLYSRSSRGILCFHILGMFRNFAQWVNIGILDSNPCRPTPAPVQHGWDDGPHEAPLFELSGVSE